MGESRQQWVDVAKGIAIIAVVLFHIEYNYINVPLMPFSALFGEMWHVAVFFLIGGFFIKEEKLTNPVPFVKGKVKSVYLLILYIYIPVTLLHNLWMYVGFYSPDIDYVGKNVIVWGIHDMVKHLLMAVFFAGREPILGAMWFVYVLFMALCVYSLLSFIISKFFKDETTYEGVKFLCMLVLAVLSCSLSRIFDFTIPRGNNVITAMWLIYLGQQLKNRFAVSFNNVFVLIACCVLAYHLATVANPVALVSNTFDNVVTLSVSSIAVLYIICYLSKRIQTNKFGQCIAKLGEESFYIMGLHFFGFKLATILLNLLGCQLDLALLKAPAGNSLLLCIVYLAFGLLFPVAFVSLFRLAKNACLKLVG